MKPVVIFGADTFARVVVRYLEADSPQDVVAFTVHQTHLQSTELQGRPVVPFESLVETHPPDNYAMLVAIGSSRVNQFRADMYNECKRLGYELISYVNSGVKIWDGTLIGDNTVILEDNVIQPFVHIGSNVIVWSSNHIGHDAKIGDHCFIAGEVAVSGHVTIGDHCFIGGNAMIWDGVKVGPRCIIGACAAISRDTEEGAIHSVRGTEARDIKSWDLTSF